MLAKLALIIMQNSLKYLNKNISSLIYTTANNWCKSGTRYKNKDTGTKMHKYLFLYMTKNGIKQTVTTMLMMC